MFAIGRSVREDNPIALASGLSPVHRTKTLLVMSTSVRSNITYFY